MSNNRHSISLNTKKHQDYVISILFEEFGDGRSFAEFTKDILFELGMKNCKTLNQKGLVALKTISQEQGSLQSAKSKPSVKPQTVRKQIEEQEDEHPDSDEQVLGVTLDDVMKLKIN